MTGMTTTTARSSAAASGGGAKTDNPDGNDNDPVAGGHPDADVDACGQEWLLAGVTSGDVRQSRRPPGTLRPSLTASLDFFCFLHM
jgi:hypothetical protein